MAETENLLNCFFVKSIFFKRIWYEQIKKRRYFFSYAAISSVSRAWMIATNAVSSSFGLNSSRSL